MTRQRTRYPGIPEPTTDAESLRQAVSLMREALELMQGLRGANDGRYRMVTYGELEELGLIDAQTRAIMVSRSVGQS